MTIFFLVRSEDDPLAPDVRIMAAGTEFSLASRAGPLLGELFSCSSDFAHFRGRSLTSAFSTRFDTAPDFFMVGPFHPQTPPRPECPPRANQNRSEKVYSNAGRMGWWLLGGVEIFDECDRLE